MFFRHTTPSPTQMLEGLFCKRSFALKRIHLLLNETYLPYDTFLYKGEWGGESKIFRMWVNFFYKSSDITSNISVQLQHNYRTHISISQLRKSVQDTLLPASHWEAKPCTGHTCWLSITSTASCTISDTLSHSVDVKLIMLKKILKCYSRRQSLWGTLKHF